ncbi:universal stress protein [Flavobacterium sp. LM4]|uniref:universal stress protein n=1 Tax=Flavobacterium sp. LM4 TaxID=1938609 RepID=UPI000992FA7F|nr:universal stress protein [Flavobacterium sp. LM4]OOV17597.1 universal stress protein UspA [Flavobacterium sp. LM4]
MSLSTSIIAATNFTATASNAVNYAAAFAKVKGSRLILFNSFTLSIHSSNSRISGDNMQLELNNSEERLKHLADDIARLYSIEVESLCLYSSLEEELPLLIEKNQTELVVMGMAERSIEQDLLGNSTTWVIKNVDIPVLAVPHSARFVSEKKILFAFESRNLESIQKLSWFSQTAEALKAEVEFFSVDHRVEEMIEQQQEVIGEKEQSEQRAEYRFKSIRSSDVVREIKKEIENYNADMLVMVPQKYGFWDSMVHISKTRTMASGLQIPLLSLPNF